jgi:hypothetical protein
MQMDANRRKPMQTIVGVFESDSAEPHEIDSESIKAREIKDFHPASLCVRSRLFAAVCACCKRDVTRNVTRGKRSAKTLHITTREQRQVR